MGSWLGKQETGWVIGKGLKCHAAQLLPEDAELPPFALCNGKKYEALSYGIGLNSCGGTRTAKEVVVRVDMTKHECSFQVSSKGG